MWQGAVPITSLADVVPMFSGLTRRLHWRIQTPLYRGAERITGAKNHDALLINFKGA